MEQTPSSEIRAAILKMQRELERLEMEWRFAWAREHPTPSMTAEEQQAARHREFMGMDEDGGLLD